MLKTLGAMQKMNDSDTLADDIKEYVALKGDSMKLKMVEGLSLFSSGILSHLFLFLLVSMALLFFLIALMIFLSLYVGPIFGCLAVTLLLLAIGMVLYINRKRMFVDMFVRSYCRMMFHDSIKMTENAEGDGRVQ